MGQGCYIPGSWMRELVMVERISYEWIRWTLKKWISSRLLEAKMYNIYIVVEVDTSRWQMRRAKSYAVWRRSVVQQFVIVFPVISPRGDTITLTYIEIKRGPCKNRRATLGARSMYHWPKYLSVSTLGCDQVELLAKKYYKRYVIGSLSHLK